MLSDVGWLNVLSIMGILIFGCSFGLYFMYQARKTKTRLLFYMGLAIFFNGLWYWGNFWESLAILITGKNFDNTYGIPIPYEIQAIMSFMWPPLSALLVYYVGAELMTPKRKWLIISFFLTISLIWELALFFDPMGNLTIYIPVPPGSDLIEEDLIPGSPLYFIGFIYTLSTLFFLGFGFSIKGIKSEGVIRKKYLFLSIGFILDSILPILEGLGIAGFVLFFIRTGMIVTFWIKYLGLREEPEKKEKVETEKDVKIEESLFRLSKKPDTITEEEVTFHREKKICLVCKGDVSRVNYICPKCDALYCIKCSEHLSNLENMCWVCREPFDETKPVRPFEEEEKEVDIEISKESNEKSK